MAWILVLSFAVAGTASAQLYKWVDKDGKTRYGDTPPPGAKSSTVAAPPPAPAAPDAKGAKKGPLTAAEQEQEFRKRQTEAKKAAEKADGARTAEAEREANCARAREAHRNLTSGQRIARTNASGERYFLSDEEVAKDAAQAQKAVQENCK